VVISGAGAVPGGQTSQPGAAAAKQEEGPLENLVSFDPERLELNWSSLHWQLRSGSVLLKDFGPDAKAAQQTLQVIRELRLNQYGTVGSDRPVLEYWLSNGQAPCGLASGLRVFPLDQRSLRVEKTYGQWCLRDAYRILLNFENNEEDARNALAVLRKYRFTQVGSIGAANPPLLIFLTRPGDEYARFPEDQGIPGGLPGSGVVQTGFSPGQPPQGVTARCCRR
jgi:hypothetical protein